MSNQQNAKIATWLGYILEKPFLSTEYRWMGIPQDVTDSKQFENCSPFTIPLPFYSQLDADAISLLPILMKRGYYYILQDDCVNGHQVNIGIYEEDYRFNNKARMQAIEVSKPTISEAIATAVCELIDREGI